MAVKKIATTAEYTPATTKLGGRAWERNREKNNYFETESECKGYYKQQTSWLFFPEKFPIDYDQQQMLMLSLSLEFLCKPVWLSGNFP